MSLPNSSSVAAVVAASVDNKQFAVEAQTVERKILLIASYDPAITTIVDDVPAEVFSADDTEDKYGSGFIAHRLAIKAFQGGQGVRVFVAPQAESGTGVAADGTITIAGNATENGTLSFYLAGDLYEVAVTSGDVFGDVALAIAAAVDAVSAAPCTTGVVAGAVTLTSKSLGTWGNDIDISLNWGLNEEIPAGLTAVIVDMTNGANDPDVQDVLDAIGSGDLSNAENFTDWVSGYGREVTTHMDALSAYNGTANLAEGCYAKTVFRPFRHLQGDTEEGSTGLTNVTAVATTRRALDRTSGIICVPGSPNHPQEIAALALGIMARLNSERAEQSYVGEVLTGIIPGAKAEQWTSSYASVDTAAKAGVSPTRVQSGVVRMMNVLTYYHPVAVPIASNGYRSMRNISILQNILYNIGANFDRAKWNGISIVADVAKVTNSVSRAKARDTGSVLDDLLALSTQFESRAWIFSAAFTNDLLAQGGLVVIRSGGLGFNITLPILLSGEGGIIDTVVKFDTSLTIVIG